MPINQLQRAASLGVGGSKASVLHVTENTTLGVDDVNVTCAVPGSSSITITLPHVVASAGRRYDIVCVADGGGTSVIVTAPSGEVLGKFTSVLNDVGDRVSIESNGYTYYAANGIRRVTDSGMSATPGVKGSQAYNTSDDKIYNCTVSSATAATWVAQT